MARPPELIPGAGPPAGPPAVREATLQDLAPLSRAMARAFDSDPAFSFLLGPENRLQRLERFFQTELRLIAFPHEIVWTTEERTGGAIWARPGHWGVPLSATFREGPAMIRVFGRRLGLAFWTRLRMDSRHPKKPPSYYLAAIGVEPTAQGRGAGAAIMAPMLARADAEGVPCYLEASSARSRALYERHGFVQTGVIELPGGGPSIWPMWRDPKSQSPRNKGSDPLSALD
jgi:GNAT superfamily N-acetyltransferase